jgi:hypothetical protein
MAYVVSVTPDVCLTPMGANAVPVPYPIIGKFDDVVLLAQSVRMCGRPTFTTASQITHVMGDEAGVGGGVKSGVNKSVCESVTASSTVCAEGNRVLRDGDVLKMNNGNTLGKVVFKPGLGLVIVGKHSKGGFSHRLNVRAMALIKLFLAGLEATGAGALLAAPEPTAGTKVLGWVMAVHASDQGQTAARELWSGEERETLFETAIEDVASGLGADDETAKKSGQYGEMAYDAFTLAKFLELLRFRPRAVGGPSEAGGGGEGEAGGPSEPGEGGEGDAGGGAAAEKDGLKVTGSASGDFEAAAKGIDATHLENMRLRAEKTGEVFIVRDPNPASLQYHGKLTPEWGKYLPKPMSIKLKTAKSGPNEGMVVKEDGTPFVDSNGNRYYSDYDLQGSYKPKEGGGYESSPTNDPAWREEFNRDVAPERTAADEKPVQHGANDNYVKDGKPGRQPDPDERYSVIDNGKVRRVNSTKELQDVYKEKGIPWPYDDY